MAVLRVDNVDKTYFGGYVGVKGVNFSIESGEVLTVYGKKGAGKSTLLKLISTLEEPTSGTITIDGKSVYELGTRGVNISFATYELPLMKTKSVYDNLAYPLKIRKVSEDKIRSRIASISELFDLDNILDEHVRYLSESLKARVIIARAFMKESDFYLFDNILEKFTLDERDEVLTVLSTLLSHVRGGIIYATDRLEEVTLLGGDNVLVLSHGNMIDRGTLNDIYAHPSTLESIRLMTDGGVNEYTRRVEHDIMGDYVDLFGRREIEIDEVYRGKDIIVAATPENVRLVDIHGRNIDDSYSDRASACDMDETAIGIVTHIYHEVLSDVVIVSIMDEEVIARTGPHEYKVGMDVGVDIENIMLFDRVAERKIIY